MDSPLFLFVNKTDEKNINKMKSDLIYCMWNFRPANQGLILGIVLANIYSVRTKDRSIHINA